MRINGTQSASYVEPTKPGEGKGLERTAKKAVAPEEGARYEPAKNEELVTYQKTGHVYDRATVAKLLKQSEEAYANLRSLIEKMLLKQGYALKTISAEDWAAIEVDEGTMLEAEAAIAPGGALSAEAVSDQIVEFAKAISGGDISKLEMLKGAINEGFKQAEKILGELPEISKNTYKLVMEKLDKWAEEVGSSPIP